MHQRTIPSFLRTSTTWDAHAEFERFIMHLRSCFLKYFFSSILNSWVVLLSGCLIGTAPPVSILWVMIEQVETSVLFWANEFLFAKNISASLIFSLPQGVFLQLSSCSSARYSGNWGTSALFRSDRISGILSIFCDQWGMTVYFNCQFMWFNTFMFWNFGSNGYPQDSRTSVYSWTGCSSPKSCSFFSFTGILDVLTTWTGLFGLYGSTRQCATNISGIYVMSGIASTRWYWKWRSLPEPAV